MISIKYVSVVDFFAGGSSVQGIYEIIVYLVMRPLLVPPSHHHCNRLLQGSSQSGGTTYNFRWIFKLQRMFIARFFSMNTFEPAFDMRAKACLPAKRPGLAVGGSLFRYANMRVYE